MLNFLYIQINVISMLICFMMLVNTTRRHRHHRSADQKLFDGLLVLNIAICAFDLAMWILPSYVHAVARSLHLISSMLYYLTNPLVCYLWLLYTDYKLNENRPELIKRARLYVLPLIPLAFISLSCPWTGWFFSIDAENIYHRGPLFWWMAIPSLCYLMGAVLMTLLDRRRNGGHENIAVYRQLLFLPLTIILAALLQSFYYGLSLIWACSTIGFLAIFINMQNITNDTDPLTGLFNRRRLDQHLRLLTRAPAGKGFLFCILIDLNEFKQINDTLGHLAGDHALVQTAKLLHEVRGHRDVFLARIGGDEFMIVGERGTEEDLQMLLSDLEAAERRFNESGKYSYCLSLSMGSAIYQPGESIDALISRADAGMYRAKQAHKQEKQKVSPVDAYIDPSR